MLMDVTASVFTKLTSLNLLSAGPEIQGFSII